MDGIEQRNIYCPYCGEGIEVLIDCSVDEQNYVEDCQVCCRPIEFSVLINEHNELLLNVSHENE